MESASLVEERQSLTEKEEYKSFRVIEQRQRKPDQKLVLFFHGLFKILAFLLYVFGTSAGFVTSFVFVVLLLSIDFWIVKNVAGRLLVGLRWWNIVRDGDNQTFWKFESWPNSERQIANQFQIKTFWAFLIAQELVWICLFLAAFIQLHLAWILIPVVSLSLNTSNLYGYIRCKWEAKDEEQTQNNFFSLGPLRTAWTLIKERFSKGSSSNYTPVPLDESAIYQ